MKRRAVIFSLCSFSSALLLAQASQSQQPLLRVERAQIGETSCILVASDGSYRLERLFRAKNEVYTAPPASANTHQLLGILNNDHLVSLTQSGIQQALMTDTLDAVQLAIWRGQALQRLTFASRDSRKPFKESMDPLLRWFEEILKKRPSAVRVDTPPTSCAPPQPIQGISPPAPESSASSHTPYGTDDYFFRIVSYHYYGEHSDSACTVVFEDGHFHRERGNQSHTEGRSNKTADGQLQSDEIEQLAKILNSPELKNTPESPDPMNAGFPMREAIFREGTFTDLLIQRDRKTQHLRFLTVANLPVMGGTVPAYDTSDRRVLEPLLRWMKEHTDKQSHSVETAGVGNDCYPSKNSPPAGKSPN